MGKSNPQVNLSTLTLADSISLRGHRLNWGGAYPGLRDMIRKKPYTYRLDGDSALQIKVNTRSDAAGLRAVTRFRYKTDAKETKTWVYYDFKGAASAGPAPAARPTVPSPFRAPTQPGTGGAPHVPLARLAPAHAQSSAPSSAANSQTAFVGKGKETQQPTGSSARARSPVRSLGGPQPPTADQEARPSQRQHYSSVAAAVGATTFHKVCRGCREYRPFNPATEGPD